MRKRCENKKKILLCDSANKGMHHVIKMISFWYQDRVLTFLLDSDAAISTNTSTAAVIDPSLHKVDILEENSAVAKVTMDGLCTDAGEGGTREGLTCELASIGRTCLLETFFVTTCSLHTMNCMMQSPCKKYFGNGSAGNRNLIQLLHTYFALQKEYEMCEWREI